MKFIANVKNLVSALNKVSGVRPTFPPNNAGYLFSVRDDICYVYSRDANHVARSGFSVFESEGDVDFIYPAKAAEAFSYLDDAITFDIAQDVNYTVGYTSTSGASAIRTTNNPAMLARCEDDLLEAKKVFAFPAAVLQMALNQVKTYTNKNPDIRKLLQVFDSPADCNGRMLASDGTRVIYFECEAFKDKPLALSVDHVGLVNSFLGKCASDVSVHNGSNMIFFENELGDLLGVTRLNEMYNRFPSISYEDDPFVLSFSKASALASLKYLRAEAPATKDDVGFMFEVGSRSLLFSMRDSGSKASSMPIVVNALREDVTVSAVECVANIDHMIELFESLQNNTVELRMVVRPSDNAVYFRVVDEFYVNRAGKVLVDHTQEGAIRCKTFRMVPSKV